MTLVDLRVLVVAENMLARVGLATLLAGQAGCDVVGQIDSGPSLVDDLDRYRPDVVVYDLGWTPDSALDCLSALSGVPVIVLLPDSGPLLDVIGAVRGNGHGLLLRDSQPDMIVAALSSVAAGLVVIDPALAEIAIPPAQETSLEELVEELTPREFEVLQLLAEGLPNKTIAHQLGISEHTVKFHVNAVMTKLAAQSRTEAVVRATRLGLILL